MKGKSHRLLADYLSREYLSDAPKRCARAFRLGCIQPDRNPTTYLKGSLRAQWLRGHNWGNTQRYMQRLCRRLERKRKLGIFSAYSLGKLMHYTADAFTYAHNPEFPEDLVRHNAYEQTLQHYFLRHFQELTDYVVSPAGSAMETIRIWHRRYADRDMHDIFSDASYTVAVSRSVLSQLLPTPQAT